jgi:hypothetical protein
MLDLRQKQQLITKLEKCQAVIDKEQRNSIVKLLHPDWTVNITRNDSPLVDLINIVTEVDKHPNGIDILISCVEMFERGTSAMLEVKKFWEELSTSGNDLEDPGPARKELAIADPDTKLAQELHWDRDIIVQMFVGMVKGDPKYAPWRVLALEGAREAGLHTLVRRLEYICGQLAGRNDVAHPLLYTRIGFQPGWLGAPHLIVKEIITSLITNADLRILELDSSQMQALPQLRAVYSNVQRELKEAQSKVSRNWRGSESQQTKQSEAELTTDLNDCLRTSSQHCPIVLLFEDFDQMDPSCHSWFLNDWLVPYSVNPGRVVIAIVAASGLQYLRGRNDFIHYRPNLPTMTSGDLLAWAKGWGMTDITEQEIRIANESCQGNPVEFLKCLKFWAILKHIPLPDCVEKVPLG